mgnify:FL=1
MLRSHYTIFCQSVNSYQGGIYVLALLNTNMTSAKNWSNREIIRGTDIWIISTFDFFFLSQFNIGRFITFKISNMIIPLV